MVIHLCAKAQLCSAVLRESLSYQSLENIYSCICCEPMTGINMTNYSPGLYSHVNNNVKAIGVNYGNLEDFSISLTQIWSL